MPSHLPETALACKLPTTFDKSWSNGGWICGTASPSLHCSQCLLAQPASSEDGARSCTRFLGKFRRALEHRGARACPGPSISPVRSAEEEKLEGNIRAPQISPACANTSPVPVETSGSPLLPCHVSYIPRRTPFLTSPHQLPKL